MFKRLFFLSGVIAFLLTCFVMWFWYLPKQEAIEVGTASTEMAADTAAIVTDTISDR